MYPVYMIVLDTRIMHARGGGIRIPHFLFFEFYNTCDMQPHRTRGKWSKIGFWNFQKFYFFDPQLFYVPCWVRIFMHNQHTIYYAEICRWYQAVFNM